MPLTTLKHPAGLEEMLDLENLLNYLDEAEVTVTGIMEEELTDDEYATLGSLSDAIEMIRTSVENAVSEISLLVE